MSVVDSRNGGGGAPDGVSLSIMPSWNIHTAHVERLFEDAGPADFGIADANAFLFGNYVPDIYLGFMVSDTTFHIDYCLTHLAEPSVTPVPDADCFWDRYVCRRPLPPSSRSLALGVWAHLMADRMYNGRFRAFADLPGMPVGDELRVGKQADFDAFGRSLALSSHVLVDDALLDAARRFRPYSILSEDVVRAVARADEIVAGNAKPEPQGAYRLIGEDWMLATFDACDARLKSWLRAWKRLDERGLRATSVDVRAQAGLPPADPLEADVA